jgi:hypothetical protein
VRLSVEEWHALGGGDQIPDDAGIYSNGGAFVWADDANNKRLLQSRVSNGLVAGSHLYGSSELWYRLNHGRSNANVKIEISGGGGGGGGGGKRKRTKNSGGGGYIASVEVRTTRALRAGEELFWNYGPHVPPEWDIPPGVSSRPAQAGGADKNKGTATRMAHTRRTSPPTDPSWNDS